MKPKYKILYFINGKQKSNVQIWSLATKEGMYFEMKRAHFTISDCIRYLMLKGYKIESKTTLNE